MSFEPSVVRGSVTTLSPFRYWCQKVLPLVYDNSLSYYELLCKVVEYLNETMENVNTIGENTNALYNSYLELTNYVNNYFNNLDVQEEINNKLDTMAESGELIALIAPYLPIVTPQMFGAVGDGVTDDTLAFVEFFNSTNGKYIPKGTYVLNFTERIEITEELNSNMAKFIIGQNGFKLNGGKITNLSILHNSLISPCIEAVSGIIENCNIEFGMEEVEKIIAISCMAVNENSRITISDCVFDGRNTGMFGVWSDATFVPILLNIENCLFKNIYLNGVYGEAMELNINNSHFLNVHLKSTINGGCVDITGRKDDTWCNISNCLFENTVTGIGCSGLETEHRGRIRATNIISRLKQGYAIGANTGGTIIVENSEFESGQILGTECNIKINSCKFNRQGIRILGETLKNSLVSIVNSEFAGEIPGERNEINPYILINNTPKNFNSILTTTPNGSGDYTVPISKIGYKRILHVINESTNKTGLILINSTDSTYLGVTTGVTATLVGTNININIDSTDYINIMAI